MFQSALPTEKVIKYILGSPLRLGKHFNLVSKLKAKESFEGILCIKHLISCILEMYYAPICPFHATIHGGNDFIYVKENTGTRWQLKI